jgi:hypothetical protein
MLLLILAQAMLPFHTVRADTGPKPTMEFNFTDADVTIVSGILYECDQPDCGDAAPLEELGPQRLYCETTSCQAIAYGFASYHILEIEFSDGTTRASNIFETAGFNSKYKVTVQPDDLLVEAQLNLEPITGSPLWVVLLCCVMTVGLLAIVGAVFVLRRRKTT